MEGSKIIKVYHKGEEREWGVYKQFKYGYEILKQHLDTMLNYDSDCANIFEAYSQQHIFPTTPIFSCWWPF